MTRSTRHERPDGFERLPSRFQRYVDSLESVVASLRERLPSGGATRVKVVDRLHAGGDAVYLPDDSAVEFNVARPADARNRAVIEVRLADDGDALEIRSELGGRLVVLPDVSNVIRVRVTERW